MDKIEINTISTGPSDKLILASASEARQTILNKSGTSFEVIVSRVDEGEIKREARELGLNSLDTALKLARQKAHRVSEKKPDSYVIGADQLLECEGTWFDKSESFEDAKTQLKFLRGKSHNLSTSVSVVKGGKEIWNHTEKPTLIMREISDEFLEAYIAVAGNEVLGCVGGYRLEGVGIQLFSEISGDYSAILGLPILPLLVFLRKNELVLQ
tara:strand:+ start:104118 stop:104753 length:636 start_codon:yes stop_codon:yes gene_type:complete